MDEEMSETLVDKIVSAWLTTENGKGQDLSSFVGDSAYVIRGSNYECEVAVLAPESSIVNEDFNTVTFRNVSRNIAGVDQNLLVLSFAGANPPRAYAALCAEFFDPGLNGELRKALVDDPISWWRNWKELLGNASVDLRVYDVLGELCSLRYLARHNPTIAYDWHGPVRSSYDIHSTDNLYEVKSTIVKGDRRVVIHNAFQLDAGRVPLHILHCVFENSSSGESIDDIVNELVGEDVLDPYYAEKYLTSLGLGKGRSVRRKKYLLLSVEQYDVDESFPVFDTLPLGVVDLEYTVELSSFPSQKLV